MEKKCEGCTKKESCKDKTQCNDELNEYSSVGTTIAVMSGKGGVGKSTVSSLMAIALAEKGYKVGILDADITGPSIPRLFGAGGCRAQQSDKGIVPIRSKKGIKIMSLNLLVDREDEPVIWRGPVIAGTVKQFWTKVWWDQLDYLIVDLPPGTGDVPLTVMKSLPLNGIVMVSSPQSLVTMIVKKGIRMAERLGIDVLGLVENMSYVKCPDCGKVINLFGKSELQQVCSEHGLNFLGELPLDLDFVALSDEGKIEEGYAEINTIKRPVDSIVEEIIKKEQG